eukprot:m.346297 g.346297  ORF g.346297 m.346297 type:complete len:119 (+) comp27906_c0_seq1:2760-3116(+)
MEPSSIQGLRAEVRGLAGRIGELTPQEVAAEADQCRDRCTALIATLQTSVAQLVQSLDSPPAISDNQADLEAAVATRDQLKAQVNERVAFLNTSQLELQEFTFDINRLLVNADTAVKQ